jgi:hypothetical protein
MGEENEYKVPLEVPTCTVLLDSRQFPWLSDSANTRKHERTVTFVANRVARDAAVVWNYMHRNLLNYTAHEFESVRWSLPNDSAARELYTASTLDNPTDQKFRPSRLFDSDEISH